ncbi:mycofactocin-coupled SDR family oxidoreductase [Rhodococcus fascians]|nr:mycofactocin-coupled SDR family oxidoreductase [Rhodococcus fascians]MBY4137718.1 mycofactocin-coupled SDR family oxidoreductase [Rhodococcus fascians]MBY4215637.1 mycofactocin-coupled SDR family oxidoreductase [Rhodococcus fascians]MBY4222580.1 mycofactocin-coupled SDR family oxidoreductase [Rhodococcus fascians]MBY4226271.1 mycofactocin-coupled SDR family oxidoreductase [Rhodococcus fascians]
MGKLDGTVALITGGAKGSGRSHAITLAREGADIALVDNCVADVPGQNYPGGSELELQHTRKLVTDAGRRCITIVADVRSADEMVDAAQRSIDELGKIDHLVSSAGIILQFGKLADISPEQWRTVIDTNLTGVYNVCRAVLPHMVERRTGNIVITSSTAGRAAYPNISDYGASKWAVIGLMKTLAVEYGEYGIRANCVAPTNINSGDLPSMNNNPEAYKLFCPDIENPTREQMIERMKFMHTLDVPGVDWQDVSNAYLYLLSNDARMVTGEVLHVSAGLTANNIA